MVENSQRIEDWRVLGGNRLAGNVFDRPMHADGARIVTSPVVEVRLVGDWAHHYPVALTESGSAYRLGSPTLSFGTKRAEEFVYGKLSDFSASVQSDLDPETTVIRSVQGIEHIDLYETSFHECRR